MQEKKYVFRGYSKKENGHYVAICIDLNIAAQGATRKEAIDECMELIKGYAQYICDEYPDQFEKYIPRLAPQDLIDEFNSIMSKSLQAEAKKKTIRSGSAINNFDFQPENLCHAAAV
ncbi:MAG: hypothetical protein KAT05_03960 [Spirochaetes bacterium]|nr:hypothetical protein [Spirochaetota bacterium]